MLIARKGVLVLSCNLNSYVCLFLPLKKTLIVLCCKADLSDSLEIFSLS